jgi:hypothetical protein
MKEKLTVVVVALLVIAGCTSTGHNEHKGGFRIVGAGQNQGDVTSPNDMVTIFVGAHDTMISELGNIKSSNRQVITDLEGIKTSNQQVMGELGEIKTTGRQALETAQRSLQMIEEISKRQGTGEITIFFPVRSAAIDKESLEFERLVHFADFLSRESRGRKIIFLSIGSASSTGKKKTNMKLAKKRSETPLDILDKYLVNIPHEFHKVYGTGDMYSPKGVRLKEHQRYQHTRIIALFDTSQSPPINAEAKLSSNR